MKTNVTTYVAMTAVMVAIPPSAGDTYPAGRQLIGLSFLVATQYDRDRWRFALHRRMVLAGESEAPLLEWTADLLPADAILIGWNVDHALVPLLLEAAETAPPVVAHHFLARLHRLLRGGVVDLSLPRGGAAAPPLAEVAKEMAIRSPKLDRETVLGAWATGQTDQLGYDLADEALAIWRVFVRTAGLAGIGAEAATDDWMRRRRRMRVVTPSGSRS